VLLGVVVGVALIVGATLATLGIAPFESSYRSGAALAGDLRWSHLPPERLDRLRDQAIATALEEWGWDQPSQLALPLVSNEVYSASEPMLEGSHFELITEDELQRRADEAGVYWSFHVSSPDFSWTKAIVRVSYRQHFASGSRMRDLGSRTVTLQCVPRSSQWKCVVISSSIA